MNPSAPSEIEVVHEDFARGGYRAAIFDFDGTLSLLRRNWQEVMIPMMVDVLRETGTAETKEQLRCEVEDFVMRLNGRQTIYQMIRLTEEVERRGSRALDPLEYKRRYHELLWRQVSERVDSVRRGDVPPEEMTVPGTQRLLERLAATGCELYLASGTDLTYVRDEVAMLELDRFFGPRIFGALDDYLQFSKRQVIENMIRESGFSGSAIVGFGDGFVEIEEVKKVGGLAIGVASEENARRGVNAWKRQRLLQAGADVIVGDYRQLDVLLRTIGMA